MSETGTADKVREALSVFEALRAVMDAETASDPTLSCPRQAPNTQPQTSSSTSPTHSSSPPKLSMNRREGDKKKMKKNKPGVLPSSSLGGEATAGRRGSEVNDIDAYAYTSPEALEAMSVAALRRRLVTSEGLLHRLHRQHRALEHKFVFLESQNDELALKVQHLEAAETDLDARVKARCEAREADLRAHQQAALKSVQARHQKDLAALTKRHTTAIHELEAALADATAARASSRDMDDAHRAQMEAVQKEAAALRQENELLQASLSACESRLASFSQEAPSHDTAAPSAGHAPSRSELPRHVTRLQDQVITLEFRLKQMELHCQDLQRIQLAAVLDGEKTAATGTAAGGKKPLSALVNAEVRKLFECMKRRMIADAVVMEAERSRLNELLYGLEHEVASRD